MSGALRAMVWNAEPPATFFRAPRERGCPKLSLKRVKGQANISKALVKNTFVILLRGVFVSS
jgi:hypothetical protein